MNNDPTNEFFDGVDDTDADQSIAVADDAIVDTDPEPEPPKPDAAPAADGAAGGPAEQAAEAAPDKSVVDGKPAEEPAPAAAPGPATEPKMVPLAALQEEREERKRLRERMEELERKVQPANAAPTATANTPDPDPDPLYAVSDEDIDGMLPSQYRKLQADHEAWMARQADQRRRTVEQQTAAAFEQQARGQYAHLATQGLDYDTVTQSSVNFLTAQDVAEIRHSANPSVLLYNRCLERNPLFKFIPKPAPANAAGTTPPAKTPTEPIPAANPPTASAPAPAPAPQAAPRLRDIMKATPSAEEIADEFVGAT